MIIVFTPRKSSQFYAIIMETLMKSGQLYTLL